jgi:hypothetical protein
MPADKAICFTFGRFHPTEHRSNAYFQGSLAFYQSPELGVSRWLRGLTKALDIKSDPFKILEWQETVLAELVAADAQSMAQLLERSLNQHRLHSTRILEVASSSITAFTDGLVYSTPPVSLIEKLNVHLGCHLRPKSVRGVPELLVGLHEFPKALIAVGPTDLMHASIEKLQLNPHFQCISILSNAAESAEASVEHLADCLGVRPEALLMADSNMACRWARIPPRHA